MTKTEPSGLRPTGGVERLPPSTVAVLSAFVTTTLRRLFRGRALWVCVVIAIMPVIVGLAMKGRASVSGVIELVVFLVMTVLPPVFVAASIGEEIEDRTTTYLWSRPLARWTMIVGKLLALAPVAMVLVAGGWFLAIQIGTGHAPPTQTIIGFAVGAFAIATMSAGLATLVPRHGMALSIVYLVVFDLAIGAIPASLQEISITRQIRLLTGIGEQVSLLAPVITAAIISGFWLSIGLWRIRRLES